MTWSTLDEAWGDYDNHKENFENYYSNYENYENFNNGSNGWGGGKQPKQPKESKPIAKKEKGKNNQNKTIDINSNTDIYNLGKENYNVDNLNNTDKNNDNNDNNDNTDNNNKFVYYENNNSNQDSNVYRKKVPDVIPQSVQHTSTDLHEDLNNRIRALEKHIKKLNIDIKKLVKGVTSINTNLITQKNNVFELFKKNVYDIILFMIIGSFIILIIDSTYKSFMRNIKKI
jgi:hypothetical protein